MLRWQDLLLLMVRDPRRDNEKACPMRIGSCLLGLVEQQELARREPGSLMRSVVLLAHILLGRPVNQSPLEREEGRGKRLRGQHFCWLVGV